MQTLARARDHERVARAARGRVDVELVRVAALSRLLVRQRGERGLQACHLEHHRMQVDHDLAHGGDRASHPGPRAVEMLARRVQPLELLTQREQVLERTVVQQLGDLAPRPLLGVERLPHEAAAGRGLLGDLLLGAQPGDGAVEHVRDPPQERHVLGADGARAQRVGCERAVRGTGIADDHARPAAHTGLREHRRAAEAALGRPVLDHDGLAR